MTNQIYLLARDLKHTYVKNYRPGRAHSQGPLYSSREKEREDPGNAIVSLRPQGHSDHVRGSNSIVLRENFGT